VAQGNTHVAEKGREFLANLQRWRRLALMTSLTAVLETVLAETRYEAYLFTLPNGPERVANVRRFLDLAQRYDPYQRQGLSRFLRFLDDQKAAGREIEPLPPRQAEAAQLLSVHQSKGLEFPVVVLAGIGSRFQAPESRASVLLSRRWGVAPSVVDLEHQRRHDSLGLWQVKREENEAMRAEELRLFYVAITRARDTLLMVGNFEPGSQSWARRREWPPLLGVPQATSCAEWLSLWLTDRIDWSAKSGEVAFPSACPVAWLRWQIHGGLLPPGPESPGAAEAPALPAAVATMTGVTEDAAMPVVNWDWRYPHAAATHLPAKTSASALRRIAGQEEVPAEELWAAQPAVDTPTGFRRPNSPDTGRGESLAPIAPSRPAASPNWSSAGTRGVKLSATDIGTAHHVFLQHLDPARAVSEAGLTEERDRLCAAGVLGAHEAAALNLGAILTFWNTPLGRSIQEHFADVRRELAYTAAFSPRELADFADRFAGAPADEFVVVQGAVDLAVLLPAEIWIVDFKTDHLTEEALPEKAREHERQLRLYAAALHRIYGRPVTRCFLHFLALGRSWEVAEPMRGLTQPPL
jgi:ATP-dependent helicase/nuclease subunit A